MGAIRKYRRAVCKAKGLPWPGVRPRMRIRMGWRQRMREPMLLFNWQGIPWRHARPGTATVEATDQPING